MMKKTGMKQRKKRKKMEKKENGKETINVDLQGLVWKWLIVTTTCSGIITIKR